MEIPKTGSAISKRGEKKGHNSTKGHPHLMPI